MYQKKIGINQADVMVLFGGSIIAGGDILAEAIQNEVAKKNIIVGGAGHTTETLGNVAGATDYFREFRLFYFVTRKDRKVWMFIWQRNQT